MSKKFKSQASSARAAGSTFGTSTSAFGQSINTFQTTSSPLSYIAELPDLTRITDPNTVVSLRNLGKKDSTTKAKALEEIQQSLVNVTSVDISLLDAWTDLYPRTSIDNSRRVRQLAHTLQGSLTALAGKQIVPYLPRVVGSWLCGLYDTDKAVSRAAQEAIAGSFQTEDKRKNLWKIYKDSLLKYAEDAILIQTSKTLSDERSTSSDDAEAKYVRVIGTATNMLAYLIRSNSKDVDFLNKAEPLVVDKKLWELTSNSDPTVRRPVYALVTPCVHLYESKLDWTVISNSFLAKGLHSNQLGSSLQYVEALLALTQKQPDIWTSYYTHKTSVFKRLTQFLRSGSQRGPEAYWRCLEALIKIIPTTVWQGEITNATSLIESLRSGVTHSDEPRSNLPAAWTCYVNTAVWLSSLLDNDSNSEAFLSDHVMPLIIQHVMEDSLNTSWSIPGVSSLSVALHTLQQVQMYPQLVKDLWSDLEQTLSEKMKLSAPESSEKFASSQDAVAAVSSRLFRLRSKFESTSTPGSGSLLDDSEDVLMKTAIELLVNRNGKPYGAAAVLADLSSTSTFDKSNPLFTRFVVHDATTMLQQPSAERLIDVLLLSQRQIPEALLSLLTASHLNTHGQKALSKLLSTSSSNQFDQSIMNAILDSAKTVSLPQSQLILSSVLSNSWLTADSAAPRQVVQQICDNLLPDAEAEVQIHTMHVIMNDLQISHPSPLLSSLITGDMSILFLSRLLIISESPHTTKADTANQLLAKLKSGSTASTATTALTVVRNQLSGVGPAISVLSLIETATEAYHRAEDKHQSARSLIPHAEEWQSAFDPHLSRSRPYSLSITSPLQGAVFFAGGAWVNSDIKRDSEDFSMLFRLFLYLVNLLSVDGFHNNLDETAKKTLIRNLPLALQLVNEKLTLDDANNIWINTTTEVLEEATNALSQGTDFISKCLDQDQTLLLDIWMEDLQAQRKDDATAYYHYLASSDIFTRMIEINGSARFSARFEGDLKSIRKSNNILHSSCLAYTLRDYCSTSEVGRRLFNELIADATDVKIESEEPKALRPVILLNIFLSGSSELLDGIPSQRLVFLMKNLVRLLVASTYDGNGSSEVMKLLNSILPSVLHIYGDHWQHIINVLLDIWEQDHDSDGGLPILHASFRTYRNLLTLTKTDDCSDDLLESWNDSLARLGEGLIGCLRTFDKPSLGINQPKQITVELLARILPEKARGNDEDLYKLLVSTESAVQSAAYNLLHRDVPQKQEQNSLELALGDKAIHLPTSLLTQLHDNDEFSKQYLLSWDLVFDHFSHASYRLQELYANELRAAQLLPTLLGHLVEVIRITQGRPLDASKLDLTKFELGQSESEEKEIQWLSVHLYYNCLLHLPSQTKNWLIEQKNRVKSPLETWTQKHITPSIISASLDTVNEWAKTQDTDDTPIAIKSSTKGSEVVASIAIDPESPPITISISLPGAYPLDSPTVAGRTRVGVSEKNWQSWLRTFQIIIFSTGSIIEGLVAFRRNVQGALKGQSECAICYSIIGTDMQTPNKKCGTCKNTFHGSCLFRWFKSSNSSSCPLCRNNFNYA